MNDIITKYQKWKSQGEDLRAQAKAAIEARFGELLLEAARLAEEFRTDFGTALKPPASITAFRYKAGPKPKAVVPKPAKEKVAAKAAEKAKAPKPEVVAPPAPDKKILGMQKRLATLTRKLEEARAAGSATKNLEDKIYELEDELRLAGYLK